MILFNTAVCVLFSILSRTVTSLSVSSSKTCADPWLQYEDNCYYFHNITDTLLGHSRYDARLICENFGGNLTSVSSRNESEFISDIFRVKWVKQTQHYWIGLSDKLKEGTFRWDDGTTFDNTTFQNWRRKENEPNNYNNEDCVELSWDGQWNDNKCYLRLGFICKRKLGAIAPVTPTLPLPMATNAPRSCEAGWIPWGTSCYGLIMGIPKTWEDARADCLRRFGDLVIIESKEELLFLTGELGKYSSEFWIGLSDTNTEGKFHWVDQVQLDSKVSAWRKGEPSNDYGVENCVEMYGKWAPGKWNDNYCESIHDYVCEKQSGVHNCPQGWVTHGDYCYELNAHPNQRVTWKDAHEACLQFNAKWEKKIDVAEAELVSIGSETEQKMLYDEFKKMGLPGIGNYFWTGLTRNASDVETWYWTDRSPHTYQHWQGTQGLRSYRCMKSSLANENSGWFKASCLEKNNYVCKVKRGQNRCFDPMGMQNFEIPDSSITSNSQLSFATPPHAARLYLTSKGRQTLDGAWCAKNESKRPYLQIDFGEVQKLTYMAMQGKSNTPAMVTAFYLTYSLDGVSYDTYGNYPPARFYKFRSHLSHRSTDYEKVMNLPLPAALVARYVRVYPITYHISCCMRLEFYGCPHTAENEKCGLGWNEDPQTGHCYKFNSQRTSLDAASGLCLAQGGQLLSITSKAEKEFLNSQLSALSGRYSDYWIGLTDIDAEGVFQWIDKSPVTITNWYKNNPRLKDTARNCVTIRASDGFWVNVDCISYRTFICKRTYKRRKVRHLMSNNWKTDAVYYWPLDDVDNGIAIGTKPAVAYGKFNHSDFPINYDSHTHRHYLSFDGVTNYLEVPDIGNTCASNPDSSECTHGVTISFMFYYDSISMKSRYIVDTLGQKGRNTVGYSVFIKFNRIYVALRGHEIHYTAHTKFLGKKWNHFVFKWSTLEGLKLYVNGLLRFRRLFGSRNPVYIKKQMVTGMFIGRSASAAAGFVKIGLMSLAVFDRLLSSIEIIKIYKAEVGRCKWGQIAHGSYCYEFNVTALNYMDSRKSCLRNGGNLMSVHSPIEQAFLSLSVGEFGLNSEAWIGFNAIKPVYVYNWTDGTPVTYTHWGPYEPSNQFTCVNTIDGGFWRGNLCFLRKTFGCKYDRVLSADVASEREKLYNITLFNFQTRTFGCSLSKKIHLDKVVYGNLQEGCYVDLEKAKKIVEKSCSGPQCKDIRATDYYFNRTNPCRAKRMATKRLVITYKCVVDDTMDNTDGCPKYYTGYNKNGEACYKLYQQKLNVSDAQKVCKEDGGALTSISSDHEELFLTTLMSEMFEVSQVWIGLIYDSPSQKFSWMNKEKMTYTNWFNKEPDPRDGKHARVSIHHGSDRFMYWSTANGTEKHPFFCRAARRGMKPTTPAGPSTTPVGTCPTGWYNSSNYCYYANNQSMQHAQAAAFCRNLGSDLASITRDVENEFLFKLLARSKTRWFSAWIGLTNEAIVKGYRWLDGTPLSYINWYSSTPYTGSRHLCVGMNSGGKWWDLSCHSRYPSFCKMKRGTAIKTTATVSTTKTKRGPSLCEQGWKHFNGSCYYFSLGYKDFHLAAQNCTNMSSNLVSIQTPAENAFIKSGMPSTMPSFVNPYLFSPFYIGMHDMSTESGWEWTDNSLVRYVNWDVKQPNNWHDEEDCVAMRANGKWNDVSCSLKLRYVCEKHNKTVLPKPQPTPTPDSGICKKGWLRYGTKCYLFKLEAKDRRNQNDAKGYCKDFGKGADLVSIHSNYENAFLLSQLREATYPVYIGLGDYMKEGKFSWTDQTSVDYTNWYLRQPSRYRNEDCVEMFPFYLYRGHWNDVHCATELGFICQVDSESGKPPPTLPPTKESCPKGYKKYARDCYKLNTTSMEYRYAMAECRKMKNGDLVAFHDPYHQAFAFSTYASAQVKESWTGLHKTWKESKLHWTDQSDLDYHHWKDGQIVYPSKDAHVCVSQVFSKKLDGRWVATNCSRELPFMCKVTREAKPVVQYKGSCLQDWTMYDKTCYRYFKADRASWPEARERCKRFGGDLATVNTKEIQSILLYLVRSSFATVWIGLNDREQEHVWRWSSGQPFSSLYTNWGDVEPNDNSGVENCVEMFSGNGQWNDLPCRHRHPFICEHPLECRKPLGMENGTIKDEAITVSNYTESFFPRFARLRSMNNGLQTSWCTPITDGKQNLTINLGGLMHVTNIQTQGLFPYHVISYKLFYSDDGIDWKAYTEMKGSAPEPRILPGNEKGSKVEGVSVDLHAVFVRFMPILFYQNLNKNLVCLRVELLGCKSVCRNALGMADLRISDDRIRVSSSTSLRSNLRPVLIDPHLRPKFPVPVDREWCSDESDTQPWVIIDLQHAMKITRVMVYGKDTKEYTLQYSINNITEVEYQEKFSTALRVHDLSTPFVARFVKVLPKLDKTVVCLKIELYGCEFSCDTSLGMESRHIPDVLVTSSSHHGDHVGYKARLNAVSGNYWRAMVNDKSQFLQVDFTQAARITGVATQGCNTNLYVKSYYLQWSDDADFWHHSKEIIYGNVNSDTIKRNVLKQSILARYLRINPASWNDSICMRVEVYGCPIEKFTVPSNPRKSVFVGNLRLTDEVYTGELANRSSAQFKKLEKKVITAVSETYLKDDVFKGAAVEVIVNEFKSGSVIAIFTVIITDSNGSFGSGDPVEIIKKQIRKGRVGKLTVDKDSSMFKKETVITERSHVVYQSGLSEGGKIGLLVFFFLMIAAVLVTGAAFYLKRSKRGFKLQFAHKNFDNPLHVDFAPQEYGDNVHILSSHD